MSLTDALTSFFVGVFSVAGVAGVIYMLTRTKANDKVMYEMFDYYTKLTKGNKKKLEEEQSLRESIKNEPIQPIEDINELADFFNKRK